MRVSSRVLAWQGLASTPSTAEEHRQKLERWEWSRGEQGEEPLAPCLFGNSEDLAKPCPSGFSGWHLHASRTEVPHPHYKVVRQTGSEWVWTPAQPVCSDSPRPHLQHLPPGEGTNPLLKDQGLRIYYQTRLGQRTIVLSSSEMKNRI